MLSSLSRKLTSFRSATPEHRRARVRSLLRAWLYETPLFWLCMGLGLAFVCLGWLLWPFLRLRIYSFHGARIGELAVRLEELERRRLLTRGSRRKPDLYVYIANGIANQQLMKMYRRKLKIFVSPVVSTAIDRLEAAFPRNRIVLSGPLTPMQFELFTTSHRCAEFTTEELRKGQELLEKIGVPQGAPYICFQSRDPSYLKSQDPNRDFAYHDYRDSQIENYLAAVERLAELGIWSLRMGSVVSKPIKSASPLVIDYSNRFRTDFGDIFITGTCKFFLGTGSGLTEVPGVAFERPVVCVNSAPIGFMYYRATDLLIPKMYWSIELKRLLSLREIIALQADRVYDSREFQRLGIELLENTAEEIRDVALEMNARIDGTWTPEPEDEDLQNRYRACWPKNHPVTGYPSRVGALFLRQNRYLLD